jgi:hypothetical protein
MLLQTLKSDMTKDREQLFFWKHIQIPNRIWIKIPGSKTTFQFELNLFEVQTCLEKFGKLPEILIGLDLPDYEFRLT